MANDSITRINLTEAVHNEIGLSRYESSKFVEQVLELISSALIQNEQVKISKFGTFSNWLIAHFRGSFGISSLTAKPKPTFL